MFKFFGDARDAHRDYRPEADSTHSKHTDML
jgi:hypothetical protein